MKKKDRLAEPSSEEFSKGENLLDPLYIFREEQVVETVQGRELKGNLHGHAGIVSKKKFTITAETDDGVRRNIVDRGGELEKGKHRAKAIQRWNIRGIDLDIKRKITGSFTLHIYGKSRGWGANYFCGGSCTTGRKEHLMPLSRRNHQIEKGVVILEGSSINEQGRKKVQRVRFLFLSVGEKIDDVQKKKNSR